MTSPRAEPSAFFDHFTAAELLNLLADGAYITDTDRSILFWNEAAQAITGWEARDVVGRGCRDNILVHEDKDGHALCGQEHCPLHRCIITGQPSPAPILVYAQHRSGSRIPVEVTVTPVRDRSGKIIGGIELFRDLSASVEDQLRAREIQKLAIQYELPPDPRVRFNTQYQPRDIVGGDFLRIEKVGADVYVIFVADAIGHGIAAALHTMLLQSLWLEHRADLASLPTFMSILNERLHSLMRGENYFGTAVIGSYNAACGDLRIVLAGHPAPLLIRADGVGTSIGQRSPALGLFSGASYTETSERLAHGDKVLFYTDGATELFDDAGHELGTNGLLRLALTHDLRRGQLEEQLLLFSNQIHLPDDLTLVTLHRLA